MDRFDLQEKRRDWNQKRPVALNLQTLFYWVARAFFAPNAKVRKFEPCFSLPLDKQKIRHHIYRVGRGGQSSQSSRSVLRKWSGLFI